MATAGQVRVRLRAVSRGRRQSQAWPEDRFELPLANAAYPNAVPGRKTGVRDAEWIADLFRHGR
ncbi:MAG: hypothetical protein ACYDAN_14035 [Candidatus Limnocylindrales bacterium]